jgi:hypothetical protein
MRGTAVSGPGFGSASGPGVVGTGTGTVTGSREPPLTRPSSPITQAGTNLSDPVNVAEQLESLQLTSFLVRPGFGKAGRPVKVNSNYFAVRSKTGRGKII